MGKLLKAAKLFSIQTFKKIFKTIFSDASLQKAIIDTIQLRLYSKGTDSDNKQLQTDTSKQRAGNVSGWYSDVTVSIKGKKGQRTQNVTLKDTGEFYNSWYVNLSNDYYTIEANFKDIFDNFELSYSDENIFKQAITNLTQNELDFIIKGRLIPMFQNEFKKLVNGL